MEQNPLTGDWLCMIDTIPSQAYMVEGKKNAEKFCSQVNADIENGKLVEQEGKLIKLP
jgi:hypothetical protein